MRIAIVDDIASERESLRGQLEAQLARLSLDADIFEYTSGTDFLSSAKKKRFDLAFLDIYMQNGNGVDAAQSLRAFDRDCLLVFTTASTDHALDGFRVRAMHYLVKPCTDTDLTALFDEIAEHFSAFDKYIEVSAMGGTIRLRFGNILYAEHYRHQVYIYTADGHEITTRQTFREFTGSLLSDERFFLCSRGVILNLEYATDYDGTDFILKNGKRLAVSRDLARAARLAFGDFLFKRGPKP